MAISTRHILPFDRISDNLAFGAVVVVALSYLLRTTWRYRSVNRAATHARRFSHESNNPAMEKELLAVKEEGKRQQARSAADGQQSAYLAAFPNLDYPERTIVEKEQLRRDKELYHQLQNIERYPDSVGAARSRLQGLLNQTVRNALSSPSGTILDIRSYSSETLRRYFARNHTTNASKYEAYLARRKEGGPRELFPTQEFAIQWLRLAAVVKYVDGGWITNLLNFGIHSVIEPSSKSTSSSGPYPASPERRGGKLAWQVISEEFGDGDLHKNHVHVYNKLLKELAPNGVAPTGDQRGFDGLADDEGSPRCWTAAIAQQCIGLLSSSEDFFPEALGFNMTYETLPYHLLVTSRELRELKIDDYYFALHITIDNPDSGHAALARVAVERFLEGIRQRDGQEAMEAMWRRVQAGVILADGLPTTPCAPREFKLDPASRVWRPAVSSGTAPAPTLLETRLVALLRRKATAAEKMHCPSRLLIKGNTIEQWLDPLTMTAEKGLDFVRALAEKKPWVVAGDSLSSKLVQELEWGGRMFGAFSGDETKVVKRWVESLGGDALEQIAGSYERFVGSPWPSARKVTASTRLGEYASEQLVAVTEESISAILARFPSSIASDPLILTSPSMPEHFTSATEEFATVWFTHLALLEQFPLSPTKFATPLGSSVLRILRSQLGFPDLHRSEDICAGMDNVHATAGEPVDMLGLWEIGHALLRRQGLNVPPSYAELASSIAKESLVAILCADMLALRSRPYSQQAVLLGLMHGFTSTLYRWPAFLVLLEPAERAILERIRDDVENVLDDCCEERRRVEGERWWTDFVRGHERAVRELQDMF